MNECMAIANEKEQVPLFAVQFVFVVFERRMLGSAATYIDFSSVLRNFNMHILKLW